MGTVLVTGGTGFVGPKVVHALRARDLPVRALVRRPDRAGTLAAWGCELVQGDVTDADSLRRAAEGCETVVHLVAIIAGRRKDFERTMAQATRDLVAAAEAAGARRLVLMSALGTSEETKGLVPYYAAKWEMERTVEASSLEHVILRPSFVFGRDGGVLPIFMSQVRWAPVTPIVGPGTQRIQPIWVDDVAEFFAGAVDLPAAAGRTFELGGPDVVTWNELYERIKRVLGKRRPTVHLPFGLVRAGALLLEPLPPRLRPITRDQVAMIAAGDNVVTEDGAPVLFGVSPISLDDQLRRAT